MKQAEAYGQVRRMQYRIACEFRLSIQASVYAYSKCLWKMNYILEGTHAFPMLVKERDVW